MSNKSEMSRDHPEKKKKKVVLSLADGGGELQMQYNIEVILHIIDFS